MSGIRLRNGVVIATHPCSYRSVRGRTLLLVVLDECGFFRDEGSAVPDKEIYRAVLPRIVKQGMLIGISTGYRTVGLLFEKHRDYFGQDDPDVLVVSGATQQFNPIFDRSLIERSLRDDPEAVNEWSGGFRADISGFLAEEDIEACIDHDRPIELPPRSGVAYRAFCDPSGGRHDHYTLAVGHVEGVRVIIDALRGYKPPFDPMQVTQEFATLLRQYGLASVHGDNYSAEWTVAAFKEAGLRYLRAELSKSKIYAENLPAFTRRIVSLPNHSRLLYELRFLERQKHAGGSETIDHPKRSGHDDYANCCFGAIHYALRKKPQARLFTLSDITSGGGVELDPTTGRPIERDHPPRIKWITVDEASAPAARGV